MAFAHQYDMPANPASSGQKGGTEDNNNFNILQLAKRSDLHHLDCHMRLPRSLRC